MDWKKELAEAYRTPGELVSQKNVKLTASEKLFFKETEQNNLSFSVPGYYLSLVENNTNDPVRRQCIPSSEEFSVKPWELDDPLGEEKYKISERLVHRYRDRVLLLVTDTCAMYCRHCFRRNFTGGRRGVISAQEIKTTAEYVSEHREVVEVILSGGDPLTLETSVLDRILSALKEAREDIVIRIGTRIPVVLPSRIDAELTDTLKRYSPLFVMTQFNHKNEITGRSSAACSMLIDAGIPVFNQAVLLKGINDTAADLEELFHTLIRLRIKPYYLFQGDLAPGTSHFRVSLKRGLTLMKELKEILSGLSLPVYAVDLPGGGGKIPLNGDYVGPLTEKGWELKDAGGNIFYYPEE